MIKRLRLTFCDKWRVVTILSLSFVISFMVCLFAPLDLYLHNPIAFIVSWKFLLPPLLLIFLLCFTAISIFLFVICLVFKGLVSDIVLLLAWGGIIAAYVQVLFLNGHMQSISSSIIDYSGYNFPNLIIWVFITLAPLSIWLFLRYKKIVFKYEKAFVLSVLIITGMQATGLISEFSSRDLPEGYDEGIPLYMSYENVVNFSPEENIIVFILDKLDVRFMREALEMFPRLYDVLDGFTHYENNISQYLDTMPSVVSMLTEVHYEEGLTMEGYWERAWANHSYIDILRENGFVTNLYIDYLASYNNLEQIQHKTDNLGEIRNIQINSRDFFVVNMRFSLGRIVPYVLKNYFLDPIGPAFATRIFDVVVADPMSVHNLNISKVSDDMFYHYVLDNEFKRDSNKSVFMIKHLFCSHMVEQGAFDAANTMGILQVYFEKMKALGVYDISTIILIADHGASFDSRYTPVTSTLMIKPKNSRGRLVIDTETELSNAYFAESILEIAGLRRDDSEVSYYDIINGEPSPPLRFLYQYSSWWTLLHNSGTDSGTLTFYGMYEIQSGGDPMDITNWRFIEAGG